ncbi:MAG: Smr/MutS family protein [Saprospiraceae bacterium]|nr:Smr/MutS family protein [Saprospiraceae bacterium]
MERQSKLELYPSHLPQMVDFYRIIEWMKFRCVSDEARLQIDNIQFSSDPEEITRKQNSIAELVDLITISALPLTGFESIEEEGKLLQIENLPLGMESFIRLIKVLRNTKAVMTYLAHQDVKHYPSTRQLLEQMTPLDAMWKKIVSIIDEEGFVKDTASQNLSNLRNEIKNLEATVYKTFRKSVANYRSQNFLVEQEESVRNGRYVLCVLPEHKRKVPGILHAQSDSGRIFYIEPQELVFLYNSIRELKLEEEDEIRKILIDLTEHIRPEREGLMNNYFILVELDVRHAKACFAELISARKMAISNDSIELYNAFHPLLFIKNSQAGKSTVPFNLYLNQKNRILILSGPNAGGKSIVLKSMLLFQLMFQAGLLVPADRNGSMKVFKKICADIGDFQSLDNELSTYSAKLMYMKQFLEVADEATAVYIDEFGTGTEPKLGGAIAEALLEDLNKRNIFGVINTHYGNLKTFAYNTDGLVNGAMLFDEAHLRPTYKLAVGKPGTSYALEIASRMNIPDPILKKAKKLVGSSTVSFEKLLEDLGKQKLQLEDEVHKHKQRTAQLDKLIAHYSEISKTVELRRMKMKVEQKQLELQQNQLQHEQVRELYRERVSQRKEIELRKLAEEQKANHEKKHLELKYLSDKLKEIQKHKSTLEDFETGQIVRLLQFGILGKVSRVVKDIVHVEANNMVFKIPYGELELVSNAVDTKSEHSVQIKGAHVEPQFNSTLDIRGFRQAEAIDTLEVFLDRALLSNFKEVKVIHGKGNGVLKNAISKSLRTYTFIDKTWQPPAEEGGDGITMISFRG